jgi:TP901 family phage tail tape measure protein
VANEDIQFTAGLDWTALKRGMSDATTMVERTAKATRAKVDLKINISAGDLRKQVQAAVKTEQKEMLKNLGQSAVSQISSKQYGNLAQIKQPQNIAKAMDTGNVASIGAQEQAYEEQQKRELASLQANIRARYAAEDKLNKSLKSLGEKRANERQAAEEKLNRAMARLQAERERQAKQEEQQKINSLPRLRYALYDVANIGDKMGRSLTGAVGGAIKTFMDFETSFTAVQRAADVTGTKADDLKAQLISLTRDVPLSFQDVAGLSTLGAQLGVADSNLKDFALTVAQFSSVTNVSTEQAAMAFGSLGNLLHLSSAQYKNLGSAIAYAGIKAVATEKDIISVATAVGGVGTQAGLSAEYVLGLSTALASLKVPAEQSRGAMTRMFQEINRAATIDPKAMDEFANVMGMTTEKATALAKTDMGTFFTQFITGMNKVSAGDPTKITAQLDALNLSDIRITNTITRLSQNLPLFKKSMQDVGGAFASGTFLAESYKAKIDDLASRFAILKNAFAEFANTVGGTLAPYLKPLVDGLAFVVNLFNDISKNPVGATILGLGAGVVALIGGLLLLARTVASVVAGSLALRTAVTEVMRSTQGANGSFGQMIAFLLGLDGAAKKATMSMIGLGNATKGTGRHAIGYNAAAAASNTATGAMNVSSKAASIGIEGIGTAMKGLMKATIVTAIIAAAFEAIQWGISAIEESMKTSADRAKAYYGEAAQQTIIDAAKIDTQQVNSGAQSQSNVMKTVSVIQPDTLSTSTTDNAAAAASSALTNNTLADSQKALESSVISTSDALDKQTLFYGENAKAAAFKVIQDKIMSDSGNPLRKLYEDKGAVDALKKSGVDLKKYTEAIISGNDEAAQAELAKLRGYEQEKQKAYKETYAAGNLAAVNGNQGAAKNLNDQAQAFQLQSGSATIAIARLEKYDETTKGLLPDSAAVTAAADIMGESISNSGDAAANAAGKFDQFKQDFNNAFGGESEALTKFAGSLDSLLSGLDANGKGFDMMTSNGAQNLTNLRQALFDSVDAAEQMGYDSTTAISMVFAQLEQKGVDTAETLKQLKSMGGDYASAAVGIEAAQSGMYGGLTSAFNSMKNAYKQSGDAAATAAKKFRLATDVASDFSSVAKRAFDLRFSKQDSLDKISEAWRQMADDAKRAKEEIDKLDNDLGKMSNDKALKEYFLSVAEAMGDTIRAAQLRIELNKLNDDITQAEKARADATDSANKSLVGNSAAAIKNRISIRGMVTNYQGYIDTLISSGASQAEVTAAVQQSKQDFIDQATAMGYSTDELTTYSAAFDDMGTIIKNTDFSVSVNIKGMDPALAAIREFKAKADDAAQDRTSKLSMSVDYASLAKWSRGIAVLNDLSAAELAYNEGIAAHRPQSELETLRSKVSTLRTKLESGNFASGGYTGQGGKYQVAGMVHKGEYVVPREQVNQGTGLPYFMNQPRAFFTGAYQQKGAQMVALTPEDRALLRGIGQTGEVILYANNEAIARSANSGNKDIVAAGGRP